VYGNGEAIGASIHAPCHRSRQRLIRRRPRGASLRSSYSTRSQAHLPVWKAVQGERPKPGRWEDNRSTNRIRATQIDPDAQPPLSKLPRDRRAAAKQLIGGNSFQQRENRVLRGAGQRRGAESRVARLRSAEASCRCSPGRRSLMAADSSEILLNQIGEMGQRFLLAAVAPASSGRRNRRRPPINMPRIAPHGLPDQTSGRSPASPAG